MHTGKFEITSDRNRQDIDAIHRLLQTTHWAHWMARPIVEKAVANSLCFGVFNGGAQIGFARLVTDYSTYAYLTDVVIAEEFRGRGIGKALMEAIVAHPDLSGMRRVALLTVDAQKFYQDYGFTTDTGRLTYMERRSGSAAARPD